jgi:hypothetical protein
MQGAGHNNTRVRGYSQLIQAALERTNRTLTACVELRTQHHSLRSKRRTWPPLRVLFARTLAVLQHARPPGQRHPTACCVMPVGSVVTNIRVGFGLQYPCGCPVCELPFHVDIAQMQYGSIASIFASSGYQASCGWPASLLQNIFRTGAACQQITERGEAPFSDAMDGVSGLSNSTPPSLVAPAYSRSSVNSSLLGQPATASMLPCEPTPPLTPSVTLSSATTHSRSWPDVAISRMDINSIDRPFVEMLSFRKHTASGDLQWPSYDAGLDNVSHVASVRLARRVPMICFFSVAVIALDALIYLGAFDSFSLYPGLSIITGLKETNQFRIIILNPFPDFMPCLLHGHHTTFVNYASGR